MVHYFTWLTWDEKIAKVIEGANKPLNQREILRELKSRKYPMKNLNVYIHNAMRNGHIVKIKYPHKPSFYFLPGWTENGKLKDGYIFNPLTREFTHEQKTTELTTN